MDAHSHSLPSSQTGLDDLRAPVRSYFFCSTLCAMGVTSSRSRGKPVGPFLPCTARLLALQLWLVLCEFSQVLGPRCSIN